jgi:hypothetical protein
MISNILVPIDGSEYSLNAATAARIVENFTLQFFYSFIVPEVYTNNYYI